MVEHLGSNLVRDLSGFDEVSAKQTGCDREQAGQAVKQKSLEPFKNITDTVIAIKIPDNTNSHKAEKIVHDAESLGISAIAEIDLHSALAYTRKYLDDSKRILICGSLYLAGYAMKIHRG